MLHGISAFLLYFVLCGADGVVLCIHEVFRSPVIEVAVPSVIFIIVNFASNKWTSYSSPLIVFKYFRGNYYNFSIFFPFSMMDFNRVSKLC